MSSAPYSINWTEGKNAYRLARWQQEPLVKICGATRAEKPSILDLTGGLGFDSLLLAQAGCYVTLFERHSRVHNALSTALATARTHENLKSACERLTLIEADAVLYLQKYALHAEVVYLDPMFPDSKKEAKSNGAMQWLQSLAASPSLDEEIALLETAKSAALKKVVVKRPKKAPFLANQKPHHQYHYRSCRFDVY